MSHRFEEFFLATASIFRKSMALFGCLQPLAPCFSNKNRMNMKIKKKCLSQWWNDTDRRKPKHSTEKPDSLSLCPPQMSHKLHWD